jgi:hypothetical protein
MGARYLKAEEAVIQTHYPTSMSGGPGLYLPVLC